MAEDSLVEESVGIPKSSSVTKKLADNTDTREENDANAVAHTLNQD